jgi:hypothetical protein
MKYFRFSDPRAAAILCRIAVSGLVSTIVVTTAFAQGQIASGIISGSGSGPYNYSLSFTDATAATAPIGSVWYAWVPGGFFLPSVPTSANAPSGWTATIDAHSIQFTANSSANYIVPGQTLSGFSYQATFSPSQLAAAPNSGESVAYSGGLFSDAGDTFTVQTAPVPEPTSILLAAIGGVASLRRRKQRATLCLV